jgi:hypothetical protein
MVIIAALGANDNAHFEANKMGTSNEMGREVYTTKNFVIRISDL